MRAVTDSAGGRGGGGRIVVVCGPTAAGKTGLALRLAREFGGEVVGADSRQVYRHMDIGTAKPTPEQRALAPHHLIDVVDPDEPFTLADYLARARPAVDGIVARGRVPLVVGGTGLYVRALAQGFDVPRVPPDPALRAELEALAATGGVAALLQRLRRADPSVAATVDRDNPRRLVRAIEVAESALGAPGCMDIRPYNRQPFAGETPAIGEPHDGDGMPAGSRRSQGVRAGGPPALPVEARGYDALVIGLTAADRAALHARADRRVDAMMAEGFLDEVGSLYARGYAPALPALSGLGYRELGEHLREGRALDDAVQATKWATHRFIRRQLTWFRREPGIRWIDITCDGAGDEVLRLAAWWLSAPTPAAGTARTA